MGWSPLVTLGVIALTWLSASVVVAFFLARWFRWLREPE
jgi:hypothetical protein